MTLLLCNMIYRTNPITIVLLILCTMNTALNAQVPNTQKLDSLLQYSANNNKFMGSLSIAHQQQTVYQQNFGIAHIDNADTLKANATSKYRIGAISQLFTATLIFQLIEAKKLDLNTKLAKFYPKIPNANKITISDLLHHRSGLHNFTNDSLYRSTTQTQSKKELLALFEQMPTDFERDYQTAYSNTNYVLLGYIIEKISKKSYADNLQKRICKKLNLKNTSYSNQINAQNNEVDSYIFNNRQWQIVPETDLSTLHGAGAIVATPNDLNTFIRALFNGKLINPKSLDALNELKAQIGRGILPMNFEEQIGYGHKGSIDGFSATLTYFPEHDLAVAFCSNGINYKMSDILTAILSQCYDKPYQYPAFTSLNLNDEQLKMYEGIYAAPNFPLKITISTQNQQLVAQASGQPAFSLEALSETEFKFDLAGVRLLFAPENNTITMTLKQGNSNIKMTRE